MSGIINKVKDALTGDHSTTSTSHSTTTQHNTTQGSHDAAGNRHTGLDGTAGTHTVGHDTGYANTGSNTTGHGALSTGAPMGSHTTHGTTGSGLTGSNYGSTNAGPHDSNAANKLDPRVDSDRDGRSGMTGSSHTGTGSGLTGSHNTRTTGSGLTGSSNYGSTTAGPHDSNVANKLDPRVDSDRDGRSGLGNTHNTHGQHSGLSGNNHGPISGTSGVVGGTADQHRQTVGAHGAPGVGQTGYSTGSGPTGSSYGSTNAGPHDSNAANKLDPRVDSDRDGRSGMGNTHSTTGHSGYNSGVTGGNYGSSTNAGPHSSNAANAMDPRVDSDRDGRGIHGQHGVVGGTHATSGSGTAQNTAGPHNSDLLNKLDPRVDSDRDGSKTVGGNKTHHKRDSLPKDPRDAASVPPSVLQETLGAPIIIHDDAKHNRAGRHGSVSHQERHKGL